MEAKRNSLKNLASRVGWTIRDVVESPAGALVGLYIIASATCYTLGMGVKGTIDATTRLFGETQKKTVATYDGSQPLYGPGGHMCEVITFRTEDGQTVNLDNLPRPIEGSFFPNWQLPRFEQGSRYEVETVGFNGMNGDSLVSARKID